MGTVEGSYCLKWNDFTTNLSCAFNELRDDEDFFDVTLLTEESEIRCHKLILGACSPHFRAIIKRLSSVQNPAIYLRGVRHEDIKNILEFMYLGEVSVSQEDLDSFLSVAQDLCIKGLTQSESKPGPSRPVKAEPSTSYATPPPPLPPPPAKKPRMQVIQRNNGNNPHAPAKAEPKMEIQEDHDDIEVLDDDDPSQIEEYDGYYQEDDGAGPSDADLDGKDLELGLVNMDDGTAMCLKCNKTYGSVSQAKIHYKEVHATDPNDKKFTCQICRKGFAVKRYLSNHMRSIHGLSQSLIKRNYVPT